jgi:hypothetical protein
LDFFQKFQYLTWSYLELYMLYRSLRALNLSNLLSPNFLSSLQTIFLLEYYSLLNSCVSVSLCGYISNYSNLFLLTLSLMIILRCKIKHTGFTLNLYSSVYILFLKSVFKDRSRKTFKFPLQMTEIVYRMRKEI